MDINQAAPVVASGTIEIAAGPEVVWDLLADIERWPEWNADVKSTSGIRAPTPRCGEGTCL